MPDPLPVPGQDCGTGQAVGFAAQRQELGLGGAAVFRLVEPDVLAIQHLIGAQHQPARPAAADLQGFQLGQSNGRGFDIGALLLQGKLHLGFIDAGGDDLDLDAGGTQHAGARRAGGSEDEGKGIHGRRVG